MTIDRSYVVARIAALRVQQSRLHLQLAQLDGAVAVLEQTLEEGQQEEACRNDKEGTVADVNGVVTSADRAGAN